MQVFLDDSSVYSCQQEHLDQCQKAWLSLNPAKCTFDDTLLGYIISWKGIVVDPNKVNAILTAPAPQSAKALRCFLGQIRCHGCMLCHLSNFTTTLHTVVHPMLFRWTSTKNEALKSCCLKHQEWGIYSHYNLIYICMKTHLNTHIQTIIYAKCTHINIYIPIFEVVHICTNTQ